MNRSSQNFVSKESFAIRFNIWNIKKLYNNYQGLRFCRHAKTINLYYYICSRIPNYKGIKIPSNSEVEWFFSPQENLGGIAYAS
jgi:hypothetical protein